MWLCNSCSWSRQNRCTLIQRATLQKYCNLLLKKVSFEGSKWRDCLQFETRTNLCNRVSSPLNLRLLTIIARVPSKSFQVNESQLNTNDKFLARAGFSNFFLLFLSDYSSFICLMIIYVCIRDSTIFNEQIEKFLELILLATSRKYFLQNFY